MVINSDIVCITGTVRGQAKKNNVSILRKTGKSTIVTHSTIRVKWSHLLLGWLETWKTLSNTCQISSERIVLDLESWNHRKIFPF